MNNGLDGYIRFIPVAKIEELRSQKLAELAQITHWDKHRERLARFKLPDDIEIRLENRDVVELRSTPEIEAQYESQLSELIEGLLPWRKGPFNLFGQEIDAEWRAEMKWDRIASALPELGGKRIVDVGCNNGYYMFRMLADDPTRNPQLIVGLDPSSRCYYQFSLLKQFYPLPCFQYEPFGLEDLHLYPDFFHVAFCMGVIYHRKDPYSSCRLLFDCLKDGGYLFIESLIYPGDEPLSLCPTDRYAKMRNVWHIPTLNCLKVWLEKSGFTEIDEVDTTKVTVAEQRQTRLAPYESLSDFLDPVDSSKTLEGYPAPVRSIVRARKVNGR